VLLDTNVLLAAYLTRGVCEALMTVLRKRPSIVLLTCDHILAEFRRNAAKKFGQNDQDVADAAALILSEMTLVEPVPVSRGLAIDQEDRPVVGAALAGIADVLVTGDATMLRLGRVENVEIISPRVMYDRVR
jgi:putative PIN family toxin of toxin-antitoxin system